MRKSINDALLLFAVILTTFSLTQNVLAQESANTRQTDKKTKKKQQDAQPVTIPISIRAGNVKVSEQRGEIIEAGNLTVKENGEERTILNLRSISNSPLQFAVLIQEDIDSTVNLELEGIANFIRRLPRGSRVMVGYLRGGLIVRQRFTEDLEKAAKSLRVVSSSTVSSSGSPYAGIREALDRFDNLPQGRRAMLVITDGVDTLGGIQSASPSQNLELDRAILEAQRSSVAIYPIYASSAAIGGRGSSILVSYGQGSLNRLADETGGRAFFQGSSTPVSFAPFLRELGSTLTRQFALTFLSTSPRDRDFRKIEVISDSAEVKIEYPKGYKP